MDGTRTVDQIKTDYQSSFGATVEVDQIREFVEAMDSHLFLASDRFTDHFNRLKDDYDRTTVRRPCLAGKSYPGEAHNLLSLLDGMFSPPEASDCLGEIRGEITGILAPHIDYKGAKRFTVPYTPT